MFVSDIVSVRLTCFIQILIRSKAADGSSEKFKYAALVLFTILHELGHWAFFKFACNLNEEKYTPCGKLGQVFCIAFASFSMVS